jgi:hypothetical protein
VFSSYLIDIAPSFPTKEVRKKPGTVQHRQLPNITVTGEPAPLLSPFIHGIKHLQVGW